MNNRKKSTWWKDICRVCVGNNSNWFDSRIKWKMGNGRCIRFLGG